VVAIKCNYKESPINPIIRFRTVIIVTHIPLHVTIYLNSVRTSQEMYYVCGIKNQPVYSFRFIPYTYNYFPVRMLKIEEFVFISKNVILAPSVMLPECQEILYPWDVIIGYLNKFVASASRWNFLGAHSSMKDY
jgi:hypothetical protein